MSDYHNIISEYLNSSYETIKYLNDDESIQLTKNKIDDKYYVIKLEKYYDFEVFQKLKQKNLDGIPTIYELIETNNGLIVVEEYISGENLEDYISEKTGDIEDKEGFVIDVTKKVCLILDQLHSLNPPIIHRDIKPQNVLFVDDRVILVDFDIARKYEGQKEKDTFAMGTKDFAAPEQYGFSESDARTDVYGVGATVKYLCEKLKVNSTKLNIVIDKAMEMDPVNRYQSVKEIVEFLESKNNISVILKKYALPGFRKKNILHMIIALIYYFFFVYNSIGFKMEPNKYDGFYARLYDFMGGFYLFILAMFFALFNNNYLNIRDRAFRRVKTKNRFIRLLLVLVVDAGFALLSFLMYLIIVVIIFGMDKLK